MWHLRAQHWQKISVNYISPLFNCSNFNFISFFWQLFGMSVPDVKGIVFVLFFRIYGENDARISTQGFFEEKCLKTERII